LIGGALSDEVGESLEARTVTPMVLSGASFETPRSARLLRMRGFGFR
jgi:hypothetical protein